MLAFINKCVIVCIYSLNIKWRLHSQVYEADAQYRQRVSALEDRLAELESEAKRHASVLKDAQQSSQGRIDKLQEDCVQLQVGYFYGQCYYQQ
jgi:hypothetical protein